MIKKILLVLVLLCSGLAIAQEKSYQLSTHILDISEGMPAGNVSVKLEKIANSGEKWLFIAEKRTTENGRINDFLPFSEENKGIYRFTFCVADYYKQLDKETFYPFIVVVFKLEGEIHYHVPITLSASGYSTYRDS